jgi:serralysin
MSGTEKQDIMRGTSHAETISGKGGIDVITASDGNDKLIGGKDKDWLSGQGGNDLFVYASISETRSGSANRDVICDWGFGKDRIDLRQIDASSVFSGNQAFKWIGSHGFNGKAGELRYHREGSVTIVDGDINGDRTADFQIQLNGKIALKATDFLL